MNTNDLTTEELKQHAKRIKKALSNMDIDISHSSALNVASCGFGFDNFNTANAVLSKENSSNTHTNPQLNNEQIENATRMLLLKGFSIEEAQKGAVWFCSNIQWTDIDNIWIFGTDHEINSLDDFAAEAYQQLLISLTSGHEDSTLENEEISSYICEMDDSIVWKKRFMEAAHTDTLITPEIAILLGTDAIEGEKQIKKAIANYTATKQHT